MELDEAMEVLFTRLKRVTEYGFVLKPHHFMSHDRKTGEMLGYETIIFDHDFARALWGDDPYCPTMPQVGTEVTDISIDGTEHKAYTYTKDHLAKDFLLNPELYQPLWQYHIQQMARATDRPAYLGANS